MSHVQWVGRPAPLPCAPFSLPDPNEGAAVPGAVTRLAKTVTQSRDDAILAVIGTGYSSLHPDRDWIVVDCWLRATESNAVEIARDDIALFREDGQRVGLPDREEVAEQMSNLGRALIAAAAAQDSLKCFFPLGTPVDRIPFVTRTMLDSVTVTAGRISAGKLLFRAPRCAGRPARFTFEIRNRELRVAIPFRLPAADWPEWTGA